MARTKLVRKDQKKSGETLIAVKMPADLIEKLDELAAKNDSDRSKEIRNAARERIKRLLPNSYLTAAHA